MTPEERARLLVTARVFYACQPEVEEEIAHALRAAIAEEREACAKIAEGADIICNIVEDQAARERRAATIDTGRMIAIAIRARP